MAFRISLARIQHCLLLFSCLVWQTGASLSGPCSPAALPGCWPSWNLKSSFWSRRRCRNVWSWRRRHLLCPQSHTSHRQLRGHKYNRPQQQEAIQFHQKSPRLPRGKIKLRLTGGHLLLQARRNCLCLTHPQNKG